MRELFFKCIGAILVLYTGAAMGWRKGNAAMRRVQVLADICAFLGAVRDDLHFRCGRTEEILAAAQQNTRLSALPLYFSDLASGCGLQTELDNALCRTEREIAGVTRREERVLLRGALEGLGKGTQSFVISLFRYALVILPVAFVLSRIFGAVGVWHAFWITELVTAAVSLIVYRKSVRQ